MLAATVVDELELEVESPMKTTEAWRPVVTYFFCHAAEDTKRTEADIFSALLAQTIRQLGEIPLSMKTSYNIASKYGHNKKSEKCDLVSTFTEIANTIPRLYVVLDGLDECDDPTTIVTLFTNIASNVPSFRFFCSSRPLQSSQPLFQDASTVSLDFEILRPDVELFLSHELGGLSIRDEFRQEAFAKLYRASSGMFLYASLSVMALKTAVDSCSMSQALDSLPEGINGLYAGVLRHLSTQPTERRRLARDIFMWVCCGERLLSWRELEYALSWNPEIGAFSVGRRPFQSVVREICLPLIEYNEDRDVFTVSHHSVQEFPTHSGWQLKLSDAENQFLVDKSHACSFISRALVHNLAQEDAATHVEIDELQNPLVTYSRAYWCSQRMFGMTTSAVRSTSSWPSHETE